MEQAPTVASGMQEQASTVRRCSPQRSPSEGANPSRHGRDHVEYGRMQLVAAAAAVGAAQDDAPLTPARVVNRKLKALRTLPQLCAYVVADAHTFAPQNVSHAFALVAKMCAAHGIAAGGPPAALECVGAAVRRLGQQLPRLLSDFAPWDAAQCLWAMSELGCFDRAAFHALCHRASQVAVAMRPADCAMVMLAFGRLKHVHPDLLKYIPQVMLKELDQAKPCEISSVLWGFARLGMRDFLGKPFMDAISDNLLWTIDLYGCQELVMVLWAMATMGYRPERKLLRSAERRLLQLVPDMNPQDVGNALWAFGHMRYRAIDLLDELPHHIGPRLDLFKPQELSCVLLGYAWARHFHAPLLEAAVPVLVSNASCMAQQDIVIALWAYGVFSHRPGPSLPRHAAAAELAEEAEPCGLLRASACQAAPSVSGAAATSAAAAAAQAAIATAAAAGSHRTSLHEPDPLQPLASSRAVLNGHGVGLCVSDSGVGAAFRHPQPGVHLDVAVNGHAAAWQGGAAATASLNGHHPALRHRHGAAAAAPLSTAASAQAPRGVSSDERTLSGLGASTSSSSVSSTAGRDLHGGTASSAPGVNAMLATMVRTIAPAVPTLRPVGLCNLVKALANLGAGAAPEVQALVADVAAAAAARVVEFRPDEMANLLYGLSLMRFSNLQVYHACVTQLMRLMESRSAYSDARWLNHKNLNSIVHSCVTVGYTPWMLIDRAEIHNIRVRGPAVWRPRWEQGAPGFSGVEASQQRDRQQLVQQDTASQGQHPPEQQSQPQPRVRLQHLNAEQLATQPQRHKRRPRSSGHALPPQHDEAGANAPATHSEREQQPQPAAGVSGVTAEATLLQKPVRRLHKDTGPRQQGLRPRARVLGDIAPLALQQQQQQQGQQEAALVGLPHEGAGFVLQDGSNGSVVAAAAAAALAPPPPVPRVRDRVRTGHVQGLELHSSVEAG